MAITNNNRVSHSAASSVNALFSTITTTAHAITTGVSALGNLAEELNLRSEQRLHNVRVELALDRKDSLDDILDQRAATKAQRLAERKRELARDPEMADIYRQCLGEYQTILASTTNP